MNKKGFTLVEILAVIVILGIIMVVVGTKGFGAFDNTKEKIYLESQKQLKEAVNVLIYDIKYCDDTVNKDLYEKLYYNDCNELQLDFNNDEIVIGLNDLKELNYVDDKTYNNIVNTNPKIQYKISIDNGENKVECLQDCDIKTKPLSEDELEKKRAELELERAELELQRAEKTLINAIESYYENEILINGGYFQSQGQTLNLISNSLKLEINDLKNNGYLNSSFQYDFDLSNVNTLCGNNEEFECDVNNDGVVDETDSSLILKYSVGYAIEEKYIPRLDVNRDGKSNSSDAVIVMKEIDNNIPLSIKLECKVDKSICNTISSKIIKTSEDLINYKLVVDMKYPLIK